MKNWALYLALLVTLSGHCEAVINGDIVSAHDYPFFGLISNKTETSLTGLPNLWCGSTLINPEYAVTAWHCVCATEDLDSFSEDFVINFLVGDLSQPLDDRYSSEIQSVYLRKNCASFDPNLTSIYNDIALIKLRSPRILATYAALPQRGPPRTEFGMALGFGMITHKWGDISRYLRRVSELVIPCPNPPAYLDYYGSFCAVSNHVPYQGACHGDSGGPWVVNEDDGFTLYGVVSFGMQDEFQNPCPSGGTDSFTDVHLYVDWIKDTMNTFTIPT